jgi:hypothetical protein
MIASYLYRPTAFAKKPSSLVKYVTQRSLAVVLFLALAVLASVGNRPFDKRSPGLLRNRSVSQSTDNEPYLSLDLWQLFTKTAGSIKDAFNDPALIEYAKEQRIDGCDSLRTPYSNASEKSETFHSSLTN